MRPPFDPTLYLVTDTDLCRPRPVADVVRAAVAGGVTAVQVRDKNASRRDLLALTRAVQAAVAERPDVPVVVDDAVDVAGLSPVWATPTKPEAGPGLGPDAVRELARAAHTGGLLAVAIGGIDSARAAAVAATGVDGLCVVSAVCADPAPQEAAARLRAAMAPVGAR